jgi:hypothetical protein
VPPRFRSSARGSTADILRLATTAPAAGRLMLLRTARKHGGSWLTAGACSRPGASADRFDQVRAAILAAGPGDRCNSAPALGANGMKLIEALVVIALGDDKARQNLFGERTAWPTLRDRMTAREMLLERGFGRPLPVEEIDASAEGESLPEIIINLPRCRLRCRDTGSSPGLCQWRKPKTADRTAASTMTAASADRSQRPSTGRCPRVARQKRP